ncbi:tetratricopeptide repeat protein [uncultured Cytophaga sp.]|uniref:tetratricopeptide repeat protein n=1 Tax=uncultured Cytophaga sp. TaxID=160238 RepID=UPI0026027413|nr:tetratricopeptide repeat protein [uncultured Cytophaga sp.]
MPTSDKIRNSKVARWVVYCFIGMVGLLFIKSLISLYEDFRLGIIEDTIRKNSMEIKRKKASDYVYHNEIDSLMTLEEYPKIIEISELRIIKYPEDKASLNRFIGDVYYYKGDRDSAILKYTKAINVSESYVDAYIDRGLVYMELDSLDLAITDFEFAASRNYIIFLNLGMAQEKKGFLQRAIKSYDSYLKEKPEDLQWKQRRDSLSIKVNKSNYKNEIVEGEYLEYRNP